MFYFSLRDINKNELTSWIKTASKIYIAKMNKNYYNQDHPIIGSN
mgnify:CR=1 FL=1